MIGELTTDLLQVPSTEYFIVAQNQHGYRFVVRSFDAVRRTYAVLFATINNFVPGTQ
jgi:hypothetical protein